jgi:hypothetical protein
MFKLWVALQRVSVRFILKALYFQVTLEEVHKMVATLKTSLDKEKPFLKTLLNGIHKKSLKLVKNLYVSTLGMKTFPSELQLKEAIDDLHHGKEHTLIDHVGRWFKQ